MERFGEKIRPASALFNIKSTGSMLKEQIRRLAGELMPRMIDDRRHFHEHPRAFIRGIFDFGLYSTSAYIRSRSISDFDLYSTSVYIRSRLDSLGIACSGAGGAGLIAEIRGEEPSGRVTVLRADMDVLPIVEAGRPAYRSINEGVMHACGHDAHMLRCRERRLSSCISAQHSCSTSMRRR